MQDDNDRCQQCLTPEEIFFSLQGIVKTISDFLRLISDLPPREAEQYFAWAEEDLSAAEELVKKIRSAAV